LWLLVEKMIKKNALIILAASESSLPLIKKAKELHSLIVVDKNPNAPGFDFADEKVNLSTYEVNPIIRRLSQLKEKYEFKGVITRSSGMPVITMAKIAKAFNLLGTEPSIVEKIVFRDKLMEECKMLDIPAPEHQTVNKFEDIDWNKIVYPVILKPTLGIVGKKGVRKIKNEKELIVQFKDTKEASYNGCVDIETFENGHDVGLMAFSVKGRLYPFVLLDEINRFNKNGFVKPVGIMIPSQHDKEKLEICNFAQNIITKFNIDTSVFLMSCRYTHDKSIKLIEIHLDLGGDRILDDLLPRSSNVDFIRLAINVVTNQEIEQQHFNFSPVLMMFNGLRDFNSKYEIDKKGITIITADTQEELINKLSEEHKRKGFKCKFKVY